MKKQTLFLLAVLSLFIVSCSTAITGDQSKINQNKWELEYITGPRITFEGLFPDSKPVIQFDDATRLITGNSGCNGYSTKYTMNGKMISFADPELSTMMYCGDGETFFRNAMKGVNNFKIEADGKLALLKDDVVLMRFKTSMK